MEVDVLRHVSRVAAPLLLLGLAGCASGSDEAQASPACAGLVNVSDTATFTQYRAAAPADWDVTFGLLRNPCEVDISVRPGPADEALVGPMRVVSVGVNVPPPEQVFAARPATGEKPGAEGAVVVPAGATAQVVGRLRVDSATEETTVPPATLVATVNGVDTELRLAPKMKLCQCEPPAST